MTKRRALIASVTVVSGVLVLGLISWYVIRRRRRITAQRTGAQRQETASHRVQENSQCIEEEDLELPLFDLATISTATNNFSFENKIGEGGFGPVYKGQLSTGRESEENTNRVLGTYGYMSPEYAIDGLFSVKSDVFSFGVLVLEIVSGKKNRGFYHPDHDLNLLGHAWKLWNEGKPMNLADALMDSPIPTSEVVDGILVLKPCKGTSAETIGFSNFIFAPPNSEICP
ncbi:hypothetical protein Vadar_002312 [Vaccinium darrowii]|uniref:Uncharacterized protein n=1 Tax=Vaccinium darrowii TaxID=229202 RepID=A0ACB7X6T9_9ERIC|nr:hypothetical protein Vadar_002312 [Vaccinium darrowii]